MSNPINRVKDRVRRSFVSPGTATHLQHQIDGLQAAVDENRRLNERLSDVLDVMVELLVPLADRDEDRMREALARAEKLL